MLKINEIAYEKQFIKPPAPQLRHVLYNFISSTNNPDDSIVQFIFRKQKFFLPSNQHVESVNLSDPSASPLLARDRETQQKDNALFPEINSPVFLFSAVSRFPHERGKTPGEIQRGIFKKKSFVCARRKVRFSF